jgi:hypothetical protein
MMRDVGICSRADGRFCSGFALAFPWRHLSSLSTPAPFQLERDDFLEIMQFI